MSENPTPPADQSVPPVDPPAKPDKKPADVGKEAAAAPVEMAAATPDARAPEEDGSVIATYLGPAAEIHDPDLDLHFVRDQPVKVASSLMERLAAKLSALGGEISHTFHVVAEADVVDVPTGSLRPGA